MKKLIYICCFFLFIKGYSQTKRTYYYAQLHDKIEAVANAHIVNLNTKQGSFSNYNGEFRIFAKPKDSLQISFIGYKTVLKVLKISDFSLQKHKIEIVKTPIELDTVSVKRHNLSGILAIDAKKVKDGEHEVTAETLNLPNAGSRILSQAERRLHTATSSAGGIGLDPLLNWISGRTKKLKKAKVIEDKEKRITNLHDEYYNYILHELNILPEDKLLFVYFCEESPEFSTTQVRNKLVMLHFFNKKAITFKKLNPQKYKQ